MKLENGNALVATSESGPGYRSKLGDNGMSLDNEESRSSTDSGNGEVSNGQGHGANGISGDISIEDLADQMLQYLDGNTDYSPDQISEVLKKHLGWDAEELDEILGARLQDIVKLLETVGKQDFDEEIQKNPDHTLQRGMKWDDVQANIIVDMLPHEEASHRDLANDKDVANVTEFTLSGDPATIVAEHDVELPAKSVTFSAHDRPVFEARPLKDESVMATCALCAHLMLSHRVLAHMRDVHGILGSKDLHEGSLTMSVDQQSRGKLDEQLIPDSVKKRKSMELKTAEEYTEPSSEKMPMPLATPTYPEASPIGTGMVTFDHGNQHLRAMVTGVILRNDLKKYRQRKAAKAAQQASELALLQSYLVASLNQEKEMKTKKNHPKEKKSTKPATGSKRKNSSASRKVAESGRKKSAKGTKKSLNTSKKAKKKSASKMKTSKASSVKTKKKAPNTASKAGTPAKSKSTGSKAKGKSPMPTSLSQLLNGKGKSGNGRLKSKTKSKAAAPKKTSKKSKSSAMNSTKGQTSLTDLFAAAKSSIKKDGSMNFEDLM
eukprot:Clim_evm23s203 gene=Clim_evmTU23s203